MPLDCAIDLTAANALMAQQESVIREQIMQDFKYSAPYMNTIKGEVIDLANQGYTIRTVVANRVSPAWSRTAPQFTPQRLSCGSLPDSDEFGQTEYTTEIEVMKGRSHKICVNQAYNLVRNSLISAAEAMKQSIRELLEYDIRSQYVLRSGAKYVANSTQPFQARINGARKAVGAAFPNFLPDSPLNIVELQRIVSYGSTVFGSELFGAGADAHALVIVSPEQADILRQQALTAGTILAQTQGGYDAGNNSIKTLHWENFQHYGYRLNVDKEPLRFNSYDENGNPIFIEPGIEVESDYGKDYAVNPAWLYAQNEVGFVIFKNAFKRLVPKQYVGEGEWRFTPQFVMGELQWFNQRDMNCNVWGEDGFFIYRVSRAIQAWQPHAVIPVVYRRCAQDDTLTPCELIVSS